MTERIVLDLDHTFYIDSKEPRKSPCSTKLQVDDHFYLPIEERGHY